MKIHCSYDKLEDIETIKINPKNPNKHPKEQIKRLANIMLYSGVRRAITVSKRSGLITIGHGRLEAAKLNGWKQYPVDYQDYENDQQEYADMVADNAISLWAEMEMKDIKKEIEQFPDFDTDMLGSIYFDEIVSITEEPKEKEIDENINTKKTCPKCGYEW